MRAAVRRGLLMLAFACMAAASAAQSYTWDDFVEEYTGGLLADEEGESTPAGDGSNSIPAQWDGQLQELRVLHDNPVNINTATR